MVYKETVADKLSETMCTLCAVESFMLSLIYGAKVKLDPTFFSAVFTLVSEVAVNQHIQAVNADTGRKQKNMDSKDFSNGNLICWLTFRMQRRTYHKPQQVTKGEREAMRLMRSKGDTCANLAFIFDRSSHTIHQNTKDLDAVKEDY